MQTGLRQALLSLCSFCPAQLATLHLPPVKQNSRPDAQGSDLHGVHLRLREPVWNLVALDIPVGPIVYGHEVCRHAEAAARPGKDVVQLKSAHSASPCINGHHIPIWVRAEALLQGRRDQGGGFQPAELVPCLKAILGLAGACRPLSGLLAKVAPGVGLRDAGVPASGNTLFLCPHEAGSWYSMSGFLFLLLHVSTSLAAPLATLTTKARRLAARQLLARWQWHMQGGLLDLPASSQSIRRVLRQLLVAMPEDAMHSRSCGGVEVVIGGVHRVPWVLELERKRSRSLAAVVEPVGMSSAGCLLNLYNT